MTSRALAGELQGLHETRRSRRSWLAAWGRGIDRFTPFGSVFPARNGQALAAYYLGIFSLMPLFGLVLAVPALVLGIGGLRRAAHLPGREGSTHAWTGIVLGAVFGLAYLAWSLVWLAAGLA